MKSLAQIDFKLLLCLNSLLKHQNVSLAADQMNMSQPAMSRALAKLRVLFDDPLFVRTAMGMVPTRRAISLTHPLNTTLEQLSKLFESQVFEPSNCHRTFKLHMSSYNTQAHLTNIDAAFYQAAPQAHLEVINLGEKSLLSESAHNIDLAMCSNATHIPEHFHQIAVGEERMRCFMAKNHPLADEALTLNNFLAYSHILVTLGGGPNVPLETKLSTLGRVRRVGLRVPHYLGALEVLSRTQMLFSSSPLVAERFSAQFSLTSKPLPFDQSSFHYVLVWPATVHNDLAQQWLRKLCTNIIRTNLA